MYYMTRGTSSNADSVFILIEVSEEAKSEGKIRVSLIRMLMGEECG